MGSSIFLYNNTLCKQNTKTFLRLMSWTMMRPRRWRRVIEVDGDGDRMKDHIWTRIGCESKMRTKQGGFNSQRDIKGTTIMKCKYGHTMRFIQSWRWTRLYSLCGKSLFDGAFKLVVWWSWYRWCTMWMITMITVITHNRWRWNDGSWTFKVTKRTHSWTRTMIWWLTVLRTHCGNGGVNEIRIWWSNRWWHVWMRETESITWKQERLLV